MWTKAFWADAAERALRTFAQTAVTVLGTDLAGWTNLNWPQIGAVCGIAALVSVLNYIVAAPRNSHPDAPQIPAPDPESTTEATALYKVTYTEREAQP